MSISERPSSPSPKSSTRSLTLSSMPARDVGPLLKDLDERKQNFRRNMVSLAAELKEARSRLALREQSYAKETLTRQKAEIRSKKMEEEIDRLLKRLEERNEQLQASASTTEKHLKELNCLRTQLAATRAAADTNAASAQSAKLQCLEVLQELDEKNNSMKQHEDHVIRLAEQLDILQKDLQEREYSQKQLKDEVLRIEGDIMEALANSEVNIDCELRKLLNEVSQRNFDKLNKLLVRKDEEIAKLKDDLKIMSSYWKLNTMELESQLEEQGRIDQELKKKVLKLEFYLQEARSQTRKLQKMEGRRDKAVKELRDELAGKQQSSAVNTEVQNQNFWESSGFKIVVSMSMLILVVFSRR